MTEMTSSAGTIEQAVTRLRDLQRANRHDAALQAVQPLLAAHPLNRDLALIEAISLRHLHRFDDCLARLDVLMDRQPGYSLGWQERGLVHIAQRDAPLAIAALVRAVAINPALPMAWRMLEGVYRLVGDTANAAHAAAQGAALKALPPEVVHATALFSDGDLVPAEAIIRQFLIGFGDHPEAMRLLARIGLAREVLDDAEALLAAALTIAPDHRPARIDYIDVLIARHKYAEADRELAPLLAATPHDQRLRTQAGTICVGLGRHDDAIAHYRSLLADLPVLPDDPVNRATRADLNLWMGHALKTIGQRDAAIAAYREAAAIRPEFGDAWWSLANLKTFRFTDADIAVMQAGEASEATAPVDRVHLAFALGKALEDKRDHAASWDYYARGNGHRRAESRYRPEVIETNTAEQIRVCTGAFFAERAGWGCAARDPIFVLGLPRAGSTLLEQILASHPQIEGTQELPDIQRIVLELQGREPDLDHPRYPGTMADLTADQARALGERYLADTRVHRSEGRPLFIDKMPNNFRHIGLIHLILPNATIIDARREPMACCFSNLKQLFAQGQEFTYAVDDIARYYRTYLNLMRHWDTALPGRVLRVIHEDVIDDLEGQVRRMLDACGVPFDPACLAFHENRRSVRTPSSEQVRQPLFRTGLDQWRSYEAWLEPLELALGDALTTWRT
ncbi:sulfotransferase [Novosphingobium sp. FKTRR1]|uniref:sulfotransferase n=1 Tax=Novosphingobium sp. FKTRR1 TaxID=2879118 RepID=UPI001CF050E2|nr:sulfotransferase [Novosphingobium sp. FKTRR1]